MCKKAKTIGTSWTNIASYTWQPGTGFSITFYLDARYDPTKNSVENNCSYIYTRLTSVINAGSGSGSNYNFWCNYANGVSGSGVWYFANETITEGGKTTIPHNADGTKTITISAGGSVSGVGLSFSMSEDVILETIPRATACPNISGVVEGASVNISLNPASSSFKHSIKIEFNELVGYLNAEGNIQDTAVKLSSTSPVFNIGTEFYEQFDKLSAEGKIIVYTYSGSTLIGSKQGKLTISVDQTKCKPNATGTVKDVNSDTIALTNDENVIVKGYSTALITPVITASTTEDTKTTISKKYVNNTEFSSDTITIVGAIAKDYVISMTNSRGVSGESTLSADSLLDYIKLALTAQFGRSSSTSSDMKVSFNGNFFDDYFDAAKTNKNSLSISWAVKLKDEESYTTGGTFKQGTDYTIENNKFEGKDIALVNPLSDDGEWQYDLAYDFIIYYSDLLNSNLEFKDSVKKGRPYFYYYEDAEGKNHLVALDYLDVKGIVKLQGDLYYGDDLIITTIDVEE